MERERFADPGATENFSTANYCTYKKTSCELSCTSLLWDGQDNRTMAEIYGDLPSPHVQSNSPLTRSILNGYDINGLRSTLYQYQRRSVAQMVEVETTQSDTADPLYIPVVGIDGTTFYLQPATMEVLRERPMVQQNRGGVLCEELGERSAQS